MDSPLILLILLIIILLELAYILWDTSKTYHSFRDYIDAILIILFVLAAYFGVEYLLARRKYPTRCCEVKKYKEVINEGKKDIVRLMESEEYKKFKEEKKMNEEEKNEGKLSREDEDFLKELE